MASGSRERIVQRMRSRFEPRAARVARYLVNGPELVYDGDPRRRAHVDPTSFAPVRLLQHAREGDWVTIGKYCAINPKAIVLLGGEHDLDFVSVLNGLNDAHGHWSPIGTPRTSRGPVTIGSDVYIGYEAMIMSGVTIGDGAAVGARAQVTKDVEPYSIVAGNPARHIRYRFEDPVREALLRIRWWDWPDELVRERAEEINSPDAEAFARRYDPGPA